MYSSITCDSCKQTFCSKYNLLRHQKNIHLQSNGGAPIAGALPSATQGAPHGAGAPMSAPPGAPHGAGAPPRAPQGAGAPPPGAPHGAPTGAQQGAPPPPKQQQQQEQQHLGMPHGVAVSLTGESFQFRHPFTMIVSGPTSSGKSWLVNTILQHNSVIVRPPAERIVWLYRRWQPLYDVIKSTVKPKVEFIQGIPVDIEKDAFVSPAVRNMIVLDDLMSVKDARITDLFTEGSHHRNLSVIAINQNLYYNKDPTQRRNCQYLILFKNPIDKQSVLTFSRQMYPTRSGHFIEIFEKATEKPYSYLLLDLKTDTLESERLRTNIFNEDINMKVAPRTFHLLTGDQVDHNTHEMELNNNNMASCEECGLVFENVHDLYRHVKRWCPERRSEPLERPREMLEPSTERYKHNGGISTEDEQQVFQKLMRLSKENNEEIWQDKYDKYIDQGASETSAKERAELKVLPLDIDDVMRKYSSLVTYIIQLRDGPMHEQVMDAVSDFISDGYTEKSAVRMAVKKYRHLLEEYLVEDDEEDETTDTNDYESNDADNEEDSDNIDDNELTDADNEDDSNNIALL